MQISITQSCPSCGAAIELNEDYRLLECSFCGVKNYRIGNTGKRYYLPYPARPDINESNLFFFPYIRFRGTVYSIQDENIQYKIVDTTRAAFTGSDKSHSGGGDGLTPSLGVRPQAMPLLPVTSTTPGKFIPQGIPTKRIFMYAASITDILGKKKREEIYHRAFIGETISLIYWPCYLKGEQCKDAILNRTICPSAGVEKLLEHAIPVDPQWEPRFINTNCPLCGGLITGAEDAVVLRCQNCSRHWHEVHGKLEELDWMIIGQTKDSELLPFWKITVRDTTNNLNSFGDFLRFANQPVAIPQHFETLPISFTIPAFKINPKAFLQLADQLTLGQYKLSGESQKLTGRIYPANLPRNEAVESLKTIFSSTLFSKKKKFPLLPQIDFTILNIEFIYFPFKRSIHDMVEKQTGTCVQTAALRYGRTL